MPYREVVDWESGSSHSDARPKGHCVGKIFYSLRKIRLA